MFWVKKSVFDAVDQVEASGSRPSHSVSIELLDENGERVPPKGKEDAGGEVGDLIPRERQWEEDHPRQGKSVKKGGEVTPTSGIGKSLSIIGSRGMGTPTVEVRSGKEPIGVEVRTHERWMGGSTVPLRVCFVCFIFLMIQ